MLRGKMRNIFLKLCEQIIDVQFIWASWHGHNAIWAEGVAFQTFELGYLRRLLICSEDFKLIGFLF